MDVHIDRLTITMNDISGQEHRASIIAERAAALLAERLGRWAEREQREQPARVEAAGARPVNMKLQSTSTEQAAGAIAQAWLDAVLLQLRR